MRGPDIQQDSLFSKVSPESRVPKDHPLRPIWAMADTAMRELDPSAGQGEIDKEVAYLSRSLFVRNYCPFPFTETSTIHWLFKSCSAHVRWTSPGTVGIPSLLDQRGQIRLIEPDEVMVCVLI